MLTRQGRGACQPGATPREGVRGTSSALHGRRIPAPLRGALLDSETQGVALGYHAAAPSAPKPKLYKPENVHSFFTRTSKNPCPGLTGTATTLPRRNLL